MAGQERALLVQETAACLGTGFRAPEIKTHKVYFTEAH